MTIWFRYWDLKREGEGKRRRRRRRKRDDYGDMGKNIKKDWF